ncbi:TIM barrel protein [Ilyomonas limi]|uniref:TIM barrel protein n=2 Tax=Ilyomonas limi TaxID=2575867 RepID=A0A4U3KXM9_9BACT|nr:TIM barrel protein [Ilyomonas limi]
MSGCSTAQQTGTKQQQYKIGLIDLMLLKRQKLSALQLTKDLGADGVEIDMGGLGNRPTFDNKLAIDSVRGQYLNKAKALDIQFCSIGMTGFYSQSFCNRPNVDSTVADCILTMQQMHINIAFLPMGIQCDLVKNPDVRDSVVTRLKRIGAMAAKAGVIIGIETSLDAKGEVQLLKDIGSPAIKIYFNFETPLTAGRDLYEEMEILGKDRICQIHCTNKDSVWLQNDPQIDMYKVKAILDKWHWSGWLVIERSRDANDPKNVKRNYSANTAYMKRVFQNR